MNLNLEGQTALVTGSSGGIGQGIAQCLAAEGVEVIINGRSEETVMKSIKAIKKNIPYAVVNSLIADNGTLNGCEKTISTIEQVDILVNNLGIYEAVGFFEETDAEWEKLFNINVMSGVRLARHYLKKMLDKGRGRIIFISSESGIAPAPEMTHYSATKTMQLGISRALAELTKGTEVTINAVLPGPTLTENVEKFISDVFPLEKPEEAQRRFIQENRPTSLINRLIDPTEIGNVVTFLASPLSSAINGSNIRVDGGVVRTAF